MIVPQNAHKHDPLVIAISPPGLGVIAPLGLLPVTRIVVRVNAILNARIIGTTLVLRVVVAVDPKEILSVPRAVVVLVVTVRVPVVPRSPRVNANAVFVMVCASSVARVVTGLPIVP